MWRREKFAKAMQELIDNSPKGYQVLICEQDFLKEIILQPIAKFEDEYRIWNMLVSLGLFDNMGKLLYKNKIEADAAKPQVRRFLESYAIAPTIQEEIFYLMDNVFVTRGKIDYSKNQVLVQLIGKANKEAFLYLKRQERSFRVSSKDSLDKINPYDVDELYLSSSYKDAFPNLKMFPNLESFGTYLELDKSMLSQIPMKRLRRLSCSTLKGVDKLCFESDTLEELYLSFKNDYGENDNGVIIDVSGLPSLKSLSISKASNVYIKSNRKLLNLKELSIFDSYVSDFDWITYLPNIEELQMIGCRIQSIDNLNIPETLKTLEIDRNNLKVINNIQRFRKLCKLSLWNNSELINESELYELKIPNYCSDSHEIKEDDFETFIGSEAMHVVQRVNNFLNKPEDELTFSERKKRKLPYEELFMRDLNFQLKLLYEGIDDTADPDKKQRCKDYLHVHYPFIDTSNWDNAE